MGKLILHVEFLSWASPPLRVFLPLNAGRLHRSVGVWPAGAPGLKRGAADLSA